MSWIENTESPAGPGDSGAREAELAVLLAQALDAWPNRNWLVLPGPTDIGRDLARHLARALAAAEGEQAELRPAARKPPQRQERGNLEPPCNHSEAFVGTVTAGDFRTGPHCCVSTCGPCAGRSAGFVELVTGEKAEPLLTFNDARRWRRTLRDAA